MLVLKVVDVADSLCAANTRRCALRLRHGCYARLDECWISIVVDVFGKIHSVHRITLVAPSLSSENVKSDRILRLSCRALPSDLLHFGSVYAFCRVR